jgi:uncharacterized membrane protein YhaH (DUF805 family)
MNEVNPYTPPDADVEKAERYGQIRLLSVSGRLGRLRFLAYLAGVYLINVLAQGVAIGAGAGLGEDFGAIFTGLAFLVGLFLLIVSVMIAIQRLHDMNARGWWAVLYVIPLVNLVFFLVLAFAPGTEGENRWGYPPPPNHLGIVLAGLILPIVFIVGIVAAIAIPAYQGYVERAQQP